VGDIIKRKRGWKCAIGDSRDAREGSAHCVIDDRNASMSSEDADCMCGYKAPTSAKPAGASVPDAAPGPSIAAPAESECGCGHAGSGSARVWSTLDMWLGAVSASAAIAIIGLSFWHSGAKRF
jgi:hypothetical protein